MHPGNSCVISITLRLNILGGAANAAFLAFLSARVLELSNTNIYDTYTYTCDLGSKAFFAFLSVRVFDSSREERRREDDGRRELGAELQKANLDALDLQILHIGSYPQLT